MNLSNPFRGVAGEVVDNIIDFISAKINAIWQIEHKSDGSHSDIHADTITLNVEADQSDGDWGGNVGASLVPTVDGVDLGGVITRNGHLEKQHPFRTLRLSGNIIWSGFQDSGLIGAATAAIAFSGGDMVITPPLSGDFKTTATLGVQSTTLTVAWFAVSSSTQLIATTSVQAGTAVFTPILSLTDGVTAPSTVSGQAQIYVDTADGDLKVKFGDGTVKTIVVDT